MVVIIFLPRYAPGSASRSQRFLRPKEQRLPCAFNPPMSHSRTPPFARRVLLQTNRLISELRTIRRPRHDGEEGERLIRRESLAAQSLHRTSPPLQPEVVGSPTSDPTLLRHYAQMAREVLTSLPLPHPFLSSEDLELMDEHPAAAGGFADIWKAKYGGREVMLKAYRCYRSFDITQVSAVRRDRLCQVHS